MKILHLADVHLDRPFVGLDRESARGRRLELRNALGRCLRAAADEGADMITIGGDLWEDENVSADTRRSVADQLATAGVPVLLVCGNHDPFLAGGNYARTEWPQNVHVFTSETPAEYRLGDVSVWGVSWTGGSLTSEFLRTFRAPDDGRTHLLLLHGTASAAGGPYDSSAYCSFDPHDVVTAGFSLCLAGHIHAGSARQGLVYLGSPEPLGWGETGRHRYTIVEVDRGDVRIRLEEVNERSYAMRVLDCSGATSSAKIQELLDANLAGDPSPEKLYLRVELVGETDPDAEVSTDQLQANHESAYAGFQIVNTTTPAYDLEALAAQHTGRGRFVRRLMEQIEAAASEGDRVTAEHALVLGLRALDGREELV